MPFPARPGKFPAIPALHSLSALLYFQLRGSPQVSGLIMSLCFLFFLDPGAPVVEWKLRTGLKCRGRFIFRS